MLHFSWHQYEVADGETATQVLGGEALVSLRRFAEAIPLLKKVLPWVYTPPAHVDDMSARAMLGTARALAGLGNARAALRKARMLAEAQASAACTALM